MPNPVGRPLKFKSVEELQQKIDEYFDSRTGKDGNPARPISITGLALALDTTRETLLDYQCRDEYSDTIKKGKLRVENFYEERLVLKNAGGSIFALKNFGWRDTHDITTDGHSLNDLNAVNARLAELCRKAGNGSPAGEAGEDTGSK
ncbi:MAG: DNA-packaging protein [Pseudomonadota bacterium]|nr:DNA-packaging protein [Pseudomonadota bacterium]